jgi:RNA-binding motif X-linked protein 2
MNPLTQIRNTNKATRSEVALGLEGSSSWHARFKHSAYIYVGGLPYELTEGDILAVFAQYGEIVDVYLVRDKKTGKSRGFAFLAYEDQRSTVLAVDNLSGARVAGRIVRVEHVDNYKRKRAEVEGVGEEDFGEDESKKPKKVEQIDSGPKSFVDLMQEARSKGLLSRPWENPKEEEGKGRKHRHKGSHRKERDGDEYHEKKK